MTIRIERRPFRIGSSTLITLPVGWCDSHGKKIEKLTLIGDDVLILAPAGMEETAQKILDEIRKIR